MTGRTLVVYGEELGRLKGVLRDLWRDANARAVFVIDRNGMELSSAGETEQFDATSLASLAAGNVAATDGLAKLIGEREFSVLFHEGHQDHIHISVVAKRCILLVIFDGRSSLGLVRLRVRQISPRIEEVFVAVTERELSNQQSGPAVSPPQLSHEKEFPIPQVAAAPPQSAAAAPPQTPPQGAPDTPAASPARSDGTKRIRSPFSQITDEDIEALFSD